MGRRGGREEETEREEEEEGEEDSGEEEGLGGEVESGEESSGEELSDGSSDAEDINVDEEGRLAIGGSVDLRTRCYEQALHVQDDESRSTLLADCSAAFTARAKGAGEELSAGTTFWVPADAKPTTALEALALQVFAHHSRDAVFDASKSGAEWWTQTIDPADDIGFHWDRDYDLQEDQGLLLHPYLGTVTYISSPLMGAPTLVLDRPSPLMADESAAGPIRSAHACFPFPGRHLSFDGKLLHGAPSELALHGTKQAPKSTCAKRVTLLVNLWLNHEPWGAEPLPESIKKELRTPMPSVSMRLNDKGCGVEAQALIMNESPKANRTHEWVFREGDGTLRLVLPWPRDDVSAALNRAEVAPFVHVAFGASCSAKLSNEEEPPRLKFARKAQDEEQKVESSRDKKVRKR